ncbi:MAG: ABC transporter transmembrane domain-containing protein [Spirochaetales bacterium]|nr:ABC transporter transmembrane domain-containing protein [Spirochaetales bacterium]
MKEDKHNSFTGIMEFAGECKGKMIVSVILAILSVLCGLSPYFAISAIVAGFAQESAALAAILMWLAVFVAEAALKAFFYAESTLVSHKAAFGILRSIREKITAKLRRLPMGYIQERSSGQFKMLIVDEVEKLEYPLAHAIPELTSNIIAPIAVFIFLLRTDVRMAFISLLTLLWDLL